MSFKPIHWGWIRLLSPPEQAQSKDEKRLLEEIDGHDDDGGDGGDDDGNDGDDGEENLAIFG